MLDGGGVVNGNLGWRWSAASYNSGGRGYGSPLASDSTICNQVLEVLIGGVKYLVGTLPPPLYGDFI